MPQDEFKQTTEVGVIKTAEIERPVCPVCGSQILHASEYLEGLSFLEREVAVSKAKAAFGSRWETRLANLGYCKNKCGPEAVKQFPLQLFERFQRQDGP